MNNYLSDVDVKKSISLMDESEKTLVSEAFSIADRAFNTPGCEQLAIKAYAMALSKINAKLASYQCV